MTFQLGGILGSRVCVLVPQKTDLEENRIFLLVGPNGAGKTQALTDTLRYYMAIRDSAKITSSSGLPSRIIAQTLSPFSRFPPERKSPPSLLEFLSSPTEPYAAIGLTRGVGIHRSVTRDVVSRVLKRLYLKPDEVLYFGAVLKGIGCEPKISLEYIRSPLAKSVIFSEDDSKVQDSLLNFFEIIKQDGRKMAQELPLLREISDNGDLHNFALKLVGCIKEVRSFLKIDLGKVEGRGRRREKSQYLLELDLKTDEKNLRTEEKDSDSLSAILRSFLTLTRLGFLQIENFFIHFNDDSSLNSVINGQEKLVDITDASSGQQQLLSSLFGIAAEIEDNALILIDEPELSLHPEWQSTYIDSLKAIISSRKGCEILIATHSALLAQRARELGIEIIDYNFEKFNSALNGALTSDASVDQILLENFRVPVRDSAYVAHLLLSLVMRAERGENVLSIFQLLESLKNLYEKAYLQDGKIKKLIDDAMALVSLKLNERGAS